MYIFTDGITEIKNQPDPIGSVLENWEQPNGLKFSKISVPLGVLGVIYESRPNVTVDASCLALKSNNALILRGGSDSYHTSKQLVNIITESFMEANLPENIIQMIPTTDREAVDHLLEMKDYVNVIIPRGGKSLIKKINEKSKIPVIKHLEGLCHVYVDKEADIEIAKNIIFNSKLRRPEICGAAETLLIDSSLKEKALELIEPIYKAGCVIRGDDFITSLDKNFESANDEDWSTEYLDKIISIDGIEIYKPDPKVYQMVLDQFNCKIEEVLFISSNGWDIAGASKFGFTTLWVNRNLIPKDRLTFMPNKITNNLSTIPNILKELNE